MFLVGINVFILCNKVRQFIKIMEINLKIPGKVTQLPSYVLDQLKNLHPRYKRFISFFGGHPVSITKQMTNNIFTQVSQKQDGTLQSPYLVCEKTDGIRYIMLICHVQPEDYISHGQEAMNELQSSKSDPVQCYLISRQGQQKLVAYATNLNVGSGWRKNQEGSFRNVIQILDGQLIIDQKVGQLKQVCKYLIFDILVHSSQNITQLTLLHRLKEINKFIECNNFLLQNVPKQEQKAKIHIEMKDFFRLNSEKYNIVKFMLYKYIKCLPHKNDGLIFNHQSKKYEFGMNSGYVKWKPAHLNTLDFMLVPNNNLSDLGQKFENRVVDMYLATKDPEIQGNYVRSFYAFSVVSKEEYSQIEQMKKVNQDKLWNQKMDNEDNTGDKKHFQGAVIAQCKFQQTKPDQRQIFKQLFDISKSPSQIYTYVKNPFDSQVQLKRIQSLQKVIYDRCWKMYLVRDDKGLPNNITVAQRIQQSIKDNILQPDLIKKNEELNQKCRVRY